MVLDCAGIESESKCLTDNNVEVLEVVDAEEEKDGVTEEIMEEMVEGLGLAEEEMNDHMEEDLAVEAVIEDASVDLLLIDPCREVGPVPKVLHVGDVVVVEDQDLVPDLNEVTNNFHKLNGPRHKFLMKKMLD